MSRDLHRVLDTKEDRDLETLRALSELGLIPQSVVDIQHKKKSSSRTGAAEPYPKKSKSVEDLHLEPNPLCLCLTFETGIILHISIN